MKDLIYFCNLSSKTYISREYDTMFTLYNIFIFIFGPQVHFHKVILKALDLGYIF